MGVIRGLPWNVEEIVAEVAARDGSDYMSILLEAVTTLRDRGTAMPCVAVTIPLGPDIEALAQTRRFGGAPLWWIGDEHIRITFECAGDIPTAAEVDAVERIHEATGEALDLFRATYRPVLHQIPHRRGGGSDDRHGPRTSGTWPARARRQRAGGSR